MKYFSFLLVLALCSCVSEVTVQLPEKEKKLVLNCILDANSDTITVWLSYSKGISEDDHFEPIENAEINLYENGQFIGVFQNSDSTSFLLPVKVKPEKEYKIEATVDKKLIWAETSVPNQLAVDIDTIRKYNSFDYIVSFQDDSLQTNYYWISAKGYTQYNGAVVPHKADALFSSFNYADDFNRINERYRDYAFDYEDYVRIYDQMLPTGKVVCQFYPSGIDIFDGPQEIVVLSTDYHLDKFMKSALLLRDMDLSAEDVPIMYSPFPTYSNVHGGIGIFGSFTSISKTFSKD